MICPILTISSTLDKTSNSDYQCKLGECAWFDNANNCCCIKALLIELIKTGELQ